MTNMRSRPLSRPVAARKTTVSSFASGVRTPPPMPARPAKPSEAHGQPREGYVSGPFWVDTTCIDCDTCRWMAPATFTRVGNGSCASRQPATAEARVDALKALLSCPTNSIHADERSKEELQAAQQGMPTPVPGCPGVYHCGWHSVKSYGGASYLITRPPESGGNILIDSPRYNPILAKRIEELGGVSAIFLTHRDDVADHAAWAKRFGCPRILHAGEVNEGTADVEIQLQGQGPWDLMGNTLQEGAAGPGGEAEQQVQVVLTPGHTEFHACLLYAPARTLFSGDHLSQDPSEPDQVKIYTDFNWWSVPRQLDSVAMLRGCDFLTVLPGHGRRIQFRDEAHRQAAIDRLLARHGHHVPASVAA